MIEKSDKVAFQTKKFHSDELKLTCDKKFSEDPLKDGKFMRMGWLNAIFTLYHIENDLDAKFWNSFLYYPAESLKGDPNNNFKPYIKSLSSQV